MKKNNIVFLIRAYNEWTRIASVIEGILDAGFTQILVVNDGSTDATEDILDTFVDRDGVHVLHHVSNRGAGAALETGFEYIRRNAPDYSWEYVVTFDADGQHDIVDMEKFLSAFAENSHLDIVFGSRFIEKTDSNVPFFRRIILWGWKIFTSLISGVHLSDAHNGYRMMRVSVLDKIQITMDGMEYASEFIDQVGVYHFSFCEVPVNISYDEYTLSKWQRYGGALRIAFRMIFKKFF